MRDGASKQTAMAQGGTDGDDTGERRAEASLRASARPSRDDRRKAALKAKDAHDLAALLSRLSADDVTRAAMGRHGEVWHQGNRGATERTLTWLQDDQSAR